MRALCLILLAGGLAFAQLNDDTITVVASAPLVSPPPGSVSVTVTVRTASGVGLDDVLTALAPVGLTENDLSAFSPSTCFGDLQCVTTLGWTFGFTSPVASLSETFAKLTRAGSGAKKGISLSYTVSSAGDPGSSECAYPTLIAIARSHAANLASAAGLRVGRVVALSDAPAGQNVIPVAISRVGSFLFGDPMGGSVPTPVLPSVCAAAVQFQLLR